MWRRSVARVAELEFRDGKREVAEYLVNLMRGIDTVRFTYLEAIREANQKLSRDYLEGKRRDILQQHFRDNR